MSKSYSDELVSVLLSSGAPSAADRALKAQLQARYVKEFWITVASIIALLTLSRVISVLLTTLKINSSYNVGGGGEKGAMTGYSPLNRISARRLPDAMASAFRIIAFRSTLWIGPGAVLSVSEFAFIAIYIGLVLMWTFKNTRDLTIMFWEDRAAHMAACQMSLIVALAGKNNIISWLTGVSHEKLNVLHRAAGRTALLLLWIHALQRYFGGLPTQWSVATVGWMQSGVLGLTALTSAFLLSIRPIRTRFFEFFLVTHILLIGLFIVGGYMHAREPGFGSYLWPALVVWAFDRLLRIGRLVWTSKGSPAIIELLGSDTVRITVKRRMNWSAGQHAYIVMPSVSTLPSEAHPFTIASIPEPMDSSKDSNEKDVVFLVRGRQGFTKRLRERATLYDQGPVAAFIDGPYGYPPNLKQFTTCVLIAGGSGVSYTLPLLMDLVYHSRLSLSCCRRVVFVWTVRDPAHLKWISAALLQALATSQNCLSIDARIFVTGAIGMPGLSPSLSIEEVAGTPGSPVESEKKFDSIISYAGVKTEYRRPDIFRILEEEITTSPGPVSVDVAGPSAIASAVRKALRSDLARPMGVLRGRAPVVLHTETFGMVKH